MLGGFAYRLEPIMGTDQTQGQAFDEFADQEAVGAIVFGQ